MTDTSKYLGLFVFILCWIFAVPHALSLGKSSKVTIGLVEVSDQQNLEIQKSALRQLLKRVQARTSIIVNRDIPVLKPTSKKIFNYPFVILHGKDSFPKLSTEAVRNIRRYLNAGGFLAIDSGAAVKKSPFYRSANRLIDRVFPETKQQALGKDHVLYKSFYLVDTPIGRLDISDKLEVIHGEDRLKLVVARNDLLGAWAKDSLGRWVNQIEANTASAREYSFRFGLNLLMYALCINYKSDQVHIPFILERQRGQID